MHFDHGRMQDCIDACWQTHHFCQDTLYNHCLNHGEDHVTPQHVRLMTDCIQICQVAADFMTRGSALHLEVCGACAAICEKCAESCDAIDGDDDIMHRCAQICRRCADQCRQMSRLLRAA